MASTRRASCDGRSAQRRLTVAAILPASAEEGDHAPELYAADIAGTDHTGSRGGRANRR
jgi:hypothetical protein